MAHEESGIDDCIVMDGNAEGDRDGRLSDEELLIDATVLSGIADRCGFDELKEPVIHAEAFDDARGVPRFDCRIGGTAVVFEQQPGGTS